MIAVAGWFFLIRILDRDPVVDQTFQSIAQNIGRGADSGQQTVELIVTGEKLSENHDGPSISDDLGCEQYRTALDFQFKTHYFHNESYFVMTLYIRLLIVLVLARFRKHGEFLDPVFSRFMVWPTDLDILGHMTNSRYFALMDVGRTDLIARAGIVSGLWARGWYPVVVEETLQFRRSLNPFQKFQLKTQITGYDDRHFVMRQTFLIGDQVAALGLVRGRFLGPEGQRISPRQIMELAGLADAPAAVGFSQQEEQNYQYLRELTKEENAFAS